MAETRKKPIDAASVRDPLAGPRNGTAAPGGSPVEVRDASLGHPAPVGVYEHAGEPGAGRSAEDEVPVVTPPANPSSAPRGWTLGGMAVPALVVVALLIAVAAVAL